MIAVVFCPAGMENGSSRNPPSVMGLEYRSIKYLAMREPGEKMATPSAAAASERRQATILFADIAGFTALSETLDPEEVTAIVNAFYAIARRVIVSHGGTVDKFIGDSVMALFGVPIALEQAPRKAIEAAIELMAEFRTFSSERAGGPPLELHIGINSGTVVSGGMGSEGNKDFTVIGDAVNLASRLEGVAKAGQIIVGPLDRKSVV